VLNTYIYTKDICANSLRRTCVTFLQRIHANYLQRICDNSLKRICADSFQRIFANSIQRICANSIPRIYSDFSMISVRYTFAFELKINFVSLWQIKWLYSISLCNSSYRGQKINLLFVLKL